jgi:hypothetical protein
MSVPQGAIALAMLGVVACGAGGGSVAEPAPPEGEGSDVAGGQSGTDGAGAYDCDLEQDEPAGEEVPLDERPEFISCSPDDAYGRLEGEHTYRCPDLHTYLTVSIERGEAARYLVGTLPSDTPDGEDRQCWALQIDATIQIQASDDSLTFDASFGTMDHLCSTFQIGGRAVRDLQGTLSELTFELEFSESAAGEPAYFMYVRVDGGSPEVCTIRVSSEPVPGAGGAGAADE